MAMTLYTGRQTQIFYCYRYIAAIAAKVFSHFHLTMECTGIKDQMKGNGIVWMKILSEKGIAFAFGSVQACSRPYPHTLASISISTAAEKW